MDRVCATGNCLVTSIRTLNVTRLKIAFWSYEHSLIHSPWLASVAHSISLCSSFSFIFFSLSVCLSSFTNLLDGSVHKCYHESAWEMLLVRATEWVLLEIHTFFSTVPWNHLLIHIPFMMICAFRRIITGVIAKVFELLWYIGEKVETNHSLINHHHSSHLFIAMWISRTKPSAVQMLTDFGIINDHSLLLLVRFEWMWCCRNDSMVRNTEKTLVFYWF